MILTVDELIQWAQDSYFKEHKKQLKHDADTSAKPPGLSVSKMFLHDSVNAENNVVQFCCINVPNSQCFFFCCVSNSLPESKMMLIMV